MMVCQYRFIACPTGTILVGDVGQEEAMHVWGQAVYGEIFVSSSQFFCESQAALQNSLF